MDQPVLPPVEFQKALVDIRWVNRYLKGTQTLIDGMYMLIKDNPQNTFQVLDLGTGAGDIPLALYRWGKRRKLTFNITAVDRHPEAVVAARHLTHGCEHIEVVQGDALNLPYADASYDIVISSMFLHHLDTSQAVRLLQEMARLSRIGFVINDLERDPIAYYAIKLIGKVAGMGPVFQHDAPLSVLRGFRCEDIQLLKDLADLAGLQVIKKRPYRLLLLWRRPDGMS